MLFGDKLSGDELSLNFIEELTKNVQSLIDKDNGAVEENDKEIFLSAEPKVCKWGIEEILL